MFKAAKRKNPDSKLFELFENKNSKRVVLKKRHIQGKNDHR